MPRPSIDFLNAKRASMPAGAGGKIRSDRLRNPVDTRAAFDSLDSLDQAAVLIDREFSEFRSWFRNLPSVESIADGTAWEVF